MKKNFRHIVLLTLMILAVLATPASRSLSAEPVQQGIDPSCTIQCVFLLTQCAANGEKNNYHACFSVYRHCMAQCGKHD